MNMRATLASILAVAAVAAATAADYNSNRTDFRDESIYFVITTRFYDGDPANNVLCWDNQEAQISTSDPCWRGDFAGLIDRLDYIKALGFSAIWITPVVQNASGYDYHGYHALDFTRVDCRYLSDTSQGSAADVDFQDLIDAAHAKGMKIILDVVFNHTGNFGEATLCPEFVRNYKIRNQADINACMIPIDSILGSDYADLDDSSQYSRRLALMKNTDGENHDTHNYWHHVGTQWNWDEPSRWWGQIAGDCVDLNTENDAVAQFLVECYGEFIKMGVDGFRIDTSGHIARLTFNKSIIPQLAEIGEQYAYKRLNNAPFYMYGEVCARYSEVTYRNQPNLSPYFYTWASSESLLGQWNSDATWWDSQYVAEGADPLGNMLLCLEETSSSTSDNALMADGAYHTPDYSESSGFNVIDFPLHYNFSTAASAYSLASSGDKYYNDATFNVVYVDSHDYGPQPSDAVRFAGDDAQWAENLSLMFTFRGIPCLYYGSEIGFRRGVTIDNGTNSALTDTGRAYFGGYITGEVSATGFGEYSATGNALATLNHDLAQHLIRLNKMRQAVPALRKGQWTSSGCSSTSGGIAFKRAYTNDSIDSYALVALNGGATFTNCPAGTYVDIVTGTSYQVASTSSTITVSAPSNQGQLRILVKDWSEGQVGEDGPFIYTSSSSSKSWSYDGTEEDGTTSYYTADDAEQAATVTLSPSGGNFKTDTLLITATLSETAASGWYQVDNADQVTLTPGQSATFTIGSDMAYGDTRNVSWSATTSEGTTRTGSATYKKVDPNSTITIYVYAPSAPYLYSWASDDEPCGSWPGTLLSATTTVDDVDYYYYVFAGYESINIIFNTGSGGSQTGDITGITEDTYFVYDGASGYTIGKYGEEATATFSAYFMAPETWSTVYAYAWNSSLSNYEYAGSWPGTQCSYTGTQRDGLDVWKWSYSGTMETAPSHIIFNAGGQPQTDDFTFVNGAVYNIDGYVSGVASALAGSSPAASDTGVYDILGRRVTDVATLAANPGILPPGIYIAGGRKMLVK